MSNLAVIKPQVNAEIVAELEEAVERAKSGKTVGLFMLEINGTDQIKTTTRIGRRDQIVYALEYAKHRCIQEAIE